MDCITDQLVYCYSTVHRVLQNEELLLFIRYSEDFDATKLATYSEKPCGEKTVALCFEVTGRGNLSFSYTYPQIVVH